MLLILGACLVLPCLAPWLSGLSLASL
jgi:hypothetical protein